MPCDLHVRQVPEVIHEQSLRAMDYIQQDVRAFNQYALSVSEGAWHIQPAFSPMRDMAMWYPMSSVLCVDPSRYYAWYNGEALVRAKEERVYRPANKNEYRVVYWILEATCDSNDLERSHVRSEHPFLTPPSLRLKKCRRQQSSFSILKYGSDGASSRAQTVMDFIRVTGFLPPFLKANHNVKAACTAASFTPELFAPTPAQVADSRGMSGSPGTIHSPADLLVQDEMHVLIDSVSPDARAPSGHETDEEETCPTFSWGVSTCPSSGEYLTLPASGDTPMGMFDTTLASAPPNFAFGLPGPDVSVGLHECGYHFGSKNDQLETD